MKNRAHRKSAFSLVEVTLALGVTSFCLVAILGLLPIGLNTSKAAFEEAAANNILLSAAVDLRSTPATSPRGQSISSEQFGIPLPENPVSQSSLTKTVYLSDDGTMQPTLSGDSHYRLSVYPLKNGSNAHAPTLLRLKVSAPAALDPDHVAVNSVEAVIALDRN